MVARMPTAGPSEPTAGVVPSRAKVTAWALWDCGSTGMNAIVAVFVFSVYLTGTVGVGLPGDTSPASWLGRALAIGGLAVALLAPLTGVVVQVPRRRRVALTVLTGMAVAFTASMVFIRADPGYLVPGLALLALTAACGDLASVPYNAMLRQVSTPQTAGRVSGLGWAAGFTGSVLLLLLIYAGFIMGDGPTRGLLNVPVADGWNVRLAMIMAACWLAVLSLPLLWTAQTLTGAGDGSPTSSGIFGAYRRLWEDLRSEWRRDRNFVYYLMVSAVFRDGLSGIFSFAGVLGVSVYGISQADVLIFGVIGSTVAACGALLGGRLDDRIGAKPVIVVAFVGNALRSSVMVRERRCHTETHRPRAGSLIAPGASFRGEVAPWVPCPPRIPYSCVGRHRSLRQLRDVRIHHAQERGRKCDDAALGPTTCAAGARRTAPGRPRARGRRRGGRRRRPLRRGLED